MSERNKSSRRNLLVGGGVVAVGAGTLAASLLFGHSNHEPAETHKAPQPVATAPTPSGKCPESAFEAPERVTFDDINPSQLFFRVRVGACAANKNVTMLNQPDPNAETSIVANGDDAVLHPGDANNRGDVVDISCYTLGTDGNRWWMVDRHGRNAEDIGYVPRDTFGKDVDQAMMSGATPYSNTVQIMPCNMGRE